MTTPLSDDKIEAIRSALRDHPGEMTMQLAKRLEVAEAEVIRRLPDGRGVELDLSRWQELFTAFDAVGTVHVIVTNGAVTCETVGEFGGFSVWEEFFNVQSKTLDMHIRYRNLGSAFAVEKPSHMDGGRTLSVQFFDLTGCAAMKVFLNFAGKPKPERLTAFEELRQRFRA
jgi:putative heme iron utilization protein